jgi:hypothetical protein
MPDHGQLRPTAPGGAEVEFTARSRANAIRAVGLLSTRGVGSSGNARKASQEALRREWE